MGKPVGRDGILRGVGNPLARFEVNVQAEITIGRGLARDGDGTLKTPTGSTMIPEILKENERRLRKAVERRQYRDVPGLLEEIRRNAAQHPDPEIARWLQGTVEWARLMIATQRQTWADELQRLPMVNRYLDRAPESHPAVCLDL